MAVHRQTFSVETRGEVQAIDITERVASVVKSSGIREGLACVFTPHSTAAIVANEREPGLVGKDLPAALDRIVPREGRYAHNEWGEANGHSHLRSILLGPSVTFPVADGAPLLGTWQQVLFLELDRQPRTREVVVQIVGEGAAKV